ncbi:MAG: hypothetical protein P4M00_07325 [Azospirillaceae bacterium]|nr:hypothetical protein [Azospirillaceae bacterium]
MCPLFRLLLAVTTVAVGSAIIVTVPAAAAGTTPPPAESRSFIMPRGKDPGAPAPHAAPRDKVSQSLAAPPGMLGAYQVRTIRYTFSCQPGEAAMLAPAAAPPAALPPCADPFLVLGEDP